MGYADALFARDYSREQKSLQRKAKKKGLWGSVGRTLGGLVAAAFTGGMVNPVTLGLITGAGTLAGGALGAKASGVGSLKGGTFMKEDRASLERQLGAFGEANIVGALKSGVTAGIGQSVKLAKAGRAATAGGKTAEEAAKITKGVSFKEGFGESFVGRGLQKAKVAAYPTVERVALSPAAQKMASDPMGTMGEMRNVRLAESSAENLASFSSRTPLKDVRPPLTPSLSDISRSTDSYDTALETVSASDILSRKKAAMSQFFEDPKNVEGLGLSTGYSSEGYRPTTWNPKEGTDLREFSDKYKTFKDTKLAGIPEWRADARDWASEASELKSQEFQQSLGTIEGLGLPGSSGYGLSGLRSSIGRR